MRSFTSIPLTSTFKGLVLRYRHIYFINTVTDIIIYLYLHYRQWYSLWLNFTYLIAQCRKMSYVESYIRKESWPLVPSVYIDLYLKETFSSVYYGNVQFILETTRIVNFTLLTECVTCLFRSLFKITNASYKSQWFKITYLVRSRKIVDNYVRSFEEQAVI